MANAETTRLQRHLQRVGPLAPGQFEKLLDAWIDMRAEEALLASRAKFEGLHQWLNIRFNDIIVQFYISTNRYRQQPERPFGYHVRRGARYYAE